MELDLQNENLYEILDIESSSTTSDIKKAYRKKALQCHPDKNPDNPNAAIEFHKLSKILEILTDESARKAYDAVLKAKQAAAIRHRELDSKRQKLKESLEAREQSGKKAQSAQEKLNEEIARLRKEGSQQVQEEMDYVLQQVKLQRSKVVDVDNMKYRVKLKWNSSKHDKTNGGYTQEMLHKFLSKYGDITVVIMSPKKNGSALAEFCTKRGAEMAVEIEKGLASNPLTIDWVNRPATVTVSNNIKESDYESVVLTKMRQAEERKRLIEQMMAEDQEGDT